MNKIIKSNSSTLLQLIVVFVVFWAVEMMLEKYTTIEESHWLLITLIKVCLIIAIAILLDFGKTVKIENSQIIKGNYNRIFGFVKIDKKISLTEISDVILSQDSQNYFELKVVAKNDEMVIDTMPNRIPAMDELKRIENLIKNSR